MEVLLIVVLCAAFVLGVRRLFRPRAKAITANSNALHWPDLGQFECHVVGESYSQENLRKLAGNHGAAAADIETLAVLIPYSTNPHDKQAVRVEIEGLIVGHLSRDDARSFRRRLTAKKIGAKPTSCGAKIMGGFNMKDGNRASYGVMLDIKPFD